MSLPEAAPAHRAFLSWRHYRYARIAGGLNVLAIAAYAADRPDGPPNGGTALGYALGTLGLGLILWLAWFGIRRRRYGSAHGLQGLLSAHVWLGLSLVVLVSLHAGFQLHWNVHGLAFALLVLVVASGAFGAFAFWRYPPLMTANRAGFTLGGLTAELAALDARCLELSLQCPDRIVAMVGAALRRVPEHHPRMPALTPTLAPTRAAVAGLEQALGHLEATPPADVLNLVQALTARLALLERLHMDRRYRALLLLWRAVHVPLTLGLLAALAIHIFVVFYDW